MSRSRLWALALAASIGCLGTPAVAQGAVTLGAPLTGTLGNAPCTTGPYCTHTTLTAPSDRVLTAPFDGVLVRWSVRLQNTTGAPQNATLRVLRLVSAPKTFLGVRSAEAGAVAQGTDVTKSFASRLPISQGDQIGVDLPQTIGVFAVGSTSSTKDGWDPTLAGGETRTGNIGGTAAEVQIQAILERDADKDGFGDESQDGCPTNVLIQGACPVIPAALDLVAPVMSFTAAVRGHKLSRALKRGISLVVTTKERSTLTAQAFAKVRSFRAAVGPDSIVLARTTKARAGPGKTKLTLRFGRVARRSLRRKRRMNLTVEVSATDASRNTTVTSRTLRLKR